MRMPFWKMHGAGNDFILMNSLDEGEAPSTEQISIWCRRRSGVGADGLIRLCPPRADGNFYMQFFNPDGSEAEMCGNGARCAARLALDLNLAPAELIIETRAGNVKAQNLPGGEVRLNLPPALAGPLNAFLEGMGIDVQYAFANTGVPHAVIECENLDQVNVQELGRAVRQHPVFSPQGTNVDFISVTGADSLRIRTYERGVEAETQACGTGIAAAALTAVLRHRVCSPVQVLSAGGNLLKVEVTINPNNETSHDLCLTGPAEYAFQGILDTSATGQI